MPRKNRLRRYTFQSRAKSKSTYSQLLERFKRNNLSRTRVVSTNGEGQNSQKSLAGLAALTYIHLISATIFNALRYECISCYLVQDWCYFRVRSCARAHLFFPYRKCAVQSARFKPTNIGLRSFVRATSEINTGYTGFHLLGTVFVLFSLIKLSSPKIKARIDHAP